MPARDASSDRRASPRHLANIALLVVFTAAIGLIVAASLIRPAPRPTAITDARAPLGNVEPTTPILNTVRPTALHTDFAIEPRTLDELLDLPVERLAEMDIARMNLLCATDLPGAEHLDAAGVDHALATLDRWAQRVAIETDRHLYRVTDPRYAAHYRHSEAYFRAEFLLQVLQQDLGVKYDMTAADNFAFDDSRVAFLHGMIPAPGNSVADTPGGTCASMPVMYVAVGRRLGYPLKLVTTKSHIFVRWDAPDHPNPGYRGRFNIEGAGVGFGSYPDEHYTTGPFAMTEGELRANRYLVSLGPAEALAGFLAARGHCGFDNGQFGFAARCYENAYRYDTTRPAYRAWFVDAAMRSGYRPVTPALARLIDHRHRMAAGGSTGPLLNDLPRPSATRAAGTVHVPPAPRVQPFHHTPQPELFRSQP